MQDKIQHKCRESFEVVAKLTFLGMTLTYQNCRQEEMSSRLNFWNGGEGGRNACYYSVLQPVFFPFVVPEI